MDINANIYQHTLWQARTKSRVLLRVTQEVHDLEQLLLGLGHALDVTELCGHILRVDFVVDGARERADVDAAGAVFAALLGEPLVQEAHASSDEQKGEEENEHEASEGGLLLLGVGVQDALGKGLLEHVVTVGIVCGCGLPVSGALEKGS